MAWEDKYSIGVFQTMGTSAATGKLEGRILIVDDSHVFRKDIMEISSNFGLQSVEAQDGQEALDVLQSDQNFNVVLCDIRMPRLSGLELLEKVRRNASLERMPFLIITTESELNDIEKARSLGASGWLIKPLSKGAVGDVLKRFCPAKS